MLYEIRRLTQRFGDKTVLDIPSLDIEEGRIYALLGPNGAGKTTLLKLLGFLDTPTSGQIRFRGRTVAFAEPGLQALRQQVVVLDQHPILFTTTVYKNLEFGLKVRKVPPSERVRIIHDTLDLVGMGAFAQAQAHRLSGGETQRVALARALAVRPRVLFCDEPTASVDIENQEAIMRILKRINQEQHLSIVFTTHDRTQAAQLARHTLNLDCGQLTTEAPENLFGGHLGPAQEGVVGCRIQGSVMLYLPEDSAGGRSGAVRVLIDSRKIGLVLSGSAPLQANRLEGRVARVAAENGRVRIVVDVGFWLNILMEADCYRKSPPLVGESIGIVVPSEAIRLLPG